MKAFYDALAQVTKEIVDPEKNKKVKGRRIEWEYADLVNVLKAIRPLCGKHGISINQTPTIADRILTITTVLRYKDGSELVETSTFPCVSTTEQDVGKAITYYRRYVLSSIFCIAADDDVDDVTRHEQNKTTKKQTQIIKQVQESLFDIAQKKLNDCSKLHGREVVVKFLETNHKAWDQTEASQQALIKSLERGDCDAFADQYDAAMGTNYVPF